MIKELDHGTEVALSSVTIQVEIAYSRYGWIAQATVGVSGCVGKSYGDSLKGAVAAAIESAFAKAAIEALL